MSQRLEIRRESGGDRHYIGEYGVHAGEFIRVLVDDKWRDGRYEANWRDGRITAAWLYTGGEVIRLRGDEPAEAL